MDLKEKVVLVTGGDGFIGSHLVKKLVELKSKVIVVDNNVTSIPRNTEYESVTHNNCSIENVDLSRIPKVDYIFHFASVASPLVYKNDFNNVYGPNVLGTMKMIELAKRDNCRLIYASTSEVYGMLSDEYAEDGIKEDSIARCHLLTPRSIYASSKRMGEELILNYKDNGGDAINIRFFNVYGDNMDIVNTGYRRVIPNFINGIKEYNKITIFGDGKQIRSFLWIGDAVDALTKLMNYDETLPNALNIGNAESISVIDLANLLFDLLNKESPIQYKTN